MLPQKNEFFKEATLRIFSSLDVETAMKRTLEYLNQFIPISGIVLHYPLESKFKPIVSVQKNQGENLFHDMVPLPPEVTQSLTEEEVRGFRSGATTGVRILNDVFNNRQLSPKIRELFTLVFKQPISLIQLYLILEKKNVGILSFYTEAEQDYQKSHMDLINLLKDPFTIALLNIRRFERLSHFKEDLAEDNRNLRQQFTELHENQIVGMKTGLRRVMTSIRQVAPMNCPVLVLGETGVGKEVVVRAMHNYSKRHNRPFVSVNCGAIPENLIDSELFGCEKGAFTGADSQRRGFFERADRGTIFLDEIGELTLPAQVRLLRVIQEMTIERVGGNEPIPVNARIVAATNRNLKQMVDEGEFRGDLWFRLNVFPIMIPPLRDRKEDIPELVQHFVRIKSKVMKLRTTPTISTETIRHLCQYDWPGNIRELENMVERALIRVRGKDGEQALHFELLDHDHPPERSLANPVAGQLLPRLDEFLANRIETALISTRGRIYGEGGAAELLGINPSTLRSKMKKLGVPFGLR